MKERLMVNLGRNVLAKDFFSVDMTLNTHLEVNGKLVSKYPNMLLLRKNGY